MSGIHIGTSGWAYSSWKPEFYPPKTAASKFLAYYATHLNSVEVNYTFRARPTAKMLNGWCEVTPQDFRFAVKAHQRITHIKRLKDVAGDVTEFYRSIAPLASAGRLGPVLFQLPPFPKIDEPRLKSFLESLPSEAAAALEFRNASWFTMSVYELLRRHNAALCIAESDKLEVPEVITADFAYFRFRCSEYSDAALKQIERRLATAARSCEVYAFLKHEETPEGALNARRLLERLRPERAAA
jgi:uncharacterized protein YecE (DUF72 family)